MFACIFKSDKRENFLSIESRTRENWETFAKKAHAFQVALGYLTGHFAGGVGYFFAYTDAEMQTPTHFYSTDLRKPIVSFYKPVHSNPYAFVQKKSVVERYYRKRLLREVSTAEFSTLVEKILNSVEFGSCLILLLESSVASLLFMPGGFAIALESLSDLIIGNCKVKLSPIKNKSLNKQIREECKAIINKYSSNIDTSDLKALLGRIDHLNQTTNGARLKAPFELLGIPLEPHDLAILQTRNDFLHGRTPDITNAGSTRSLQQINSDLYYASMRFYTLLSLLILKWIGFDNYIVNHAQIHALSCKIKLKEAPFRKV